MQIEIGASLAALQDEDSTDDLTRIVHNSLKSLDADGLQISPVEIRNGEMLADDQYRFVVGGQALAEGQVYVDRMLAIERDDSMGSMAGIPVKEPVFGVDALWIERSQRERATDARYMTVSPSVVIATHLLSTIRKNAQLLADLPLAKPSASEFKAAMKPMRIELGLGLLPVAVPDKGGELLGKMRELRHALITELDMDIAPIHIVDNLTLASDAFRIVLHNVASGAGQTTVDEGSEAIPAHFAALFKETYQSAYEQVRHTH
ncbi:MAG: FHIPEP family type III secretion protein [Pseudomonadota bacterium]